MYMRKCVSINKILCLYIAKIGTIILHQTALYSSKYIFIDNCFFTAKITFFSELRLFN